MIEYIDAIKDYFGGGFVGGFVYGLIIGVSIVLIEILVKTLIFKQSFGSIMERADENVYKEFWVSCVVAVIVIFLV